MGKPRILQEGEQVEPDLFTQKWLAEKPKRPEKDKFKYLFERSKKSLYCNLNRDIHIKNRFSLLINQMEVQYPHYSILDGGESYKNSEVSKALYKYHLNLIKKWKDESPKKFKDSARSSNTKSTAYSDNVNSN